MGSLTDQGAAPRAPYRLTRDRNFARLWGGEAVSQVGSQVSTIAMPLLVLSLTGSPAKAGLVGVARSLANPLASLPAGVLADRIDRRAMMIGCALVRALALASIAVTLALARPALAQLLLVTLLDAMLTSAAAVAERGLIPELVPSASLPDAVTLNEARTAAAGIAGPPAGGIMFGLSHSVPFLADAVSYLIVAAALIGLRVPGRSAARDGGPASSSGIRAALQEAREGLRWLWHEPFLRAGAALYAGANVSIAAIELLGLLIARAHGASSAAIGGAFALVGVGVLLGAALARPLRRRLSARLAVLAEPWFYALLTPLFLIAHTPLTIGLLVGVMFLPLTLSTSVIVSLRLALTPERLRSRVQASASFLGSTLSWIGPLAIGVLVQYAGERTAVLTLLAWTLAVAIVASLAPGLRRIPDLAGPGAEC